MMHIVCKPKYIRVSSRPRSLMGAARSCLRVPICGRHRRKLRVALFGACKAEPDQWSYTVRPGREVGEGVLNPPRLDFPGEKQGRN